MKNLSFIKILLISFALAMFIFSGCSKAKSATDAFELYTQSWQNKDYETMYSMLSDESKKYISKEDFINRYTNIYSSIEAESIKISIDSKNKKEESTKTSIPFALAMTTAAGDINIDGYSANLVKEKVDNKDSWCINWDEKMIFPQMEKGDKVRIDTTEGKRGEIHDKNGAGLAVNGTVIQIGIYPKDFEAKKATNSEQLAKILDINPSVITEKLAANSNPEFFVPIVTISASEKDKITAALAIDGVLKQSKDNSRLYNGGEAFGSLIGYIGEITAEELKDNKDKGYSETSLIGKRGLEQVFEEKLRSKDGKHIYISRESDKSQIEIAKTEPKNGENLTLSIDSDLQKKIYDSMNGEKGASTAIDPKTGAILAMVSSPSYDSNNFTTYVTQTIKAKWEAASNAQFDNRFKLSYAPGSTFKLFTAMVGLEKSIINPTEGINISGKQWQPDKSWGDYKVTRVTDTGAAVNLKDAFVYSDNIYFAQTALKIGKEKFLEKAKEFGIGEVLPIDFPMVASKISEDGTIKNDIALADSSYGQGQVLMTPLQLALMYSSIVNDGNIMKPSLVNGTPSIWKQKVISPENAKILVEDLKAVIDDPNGTAHSIQKPGVSLAGKTGTAELKKDANDTSAEENGWLVVMNTDNPKIVMATIIENVKNNGGSHHVLDSQKKVLDYYFDK